MRFSKSTAAKPFPIEEAITDGTMYLLKCPETADRPAGWYVGSSMEHGAYIPHAEHNGQYDVATGWVMRTFSTDAFTWSMLEPTHFLEMPAVE